MIRLLLVLGLVGCVTPKETTPPPPSMFQQCRAVCEPVGVKSFSSVKGKQYCSCKKVRTTREEK